MRTSAPIQGMACFLVSAFLSPSLPQAATVTPVTSATFFTGQSFFDGSATSVGGNADILVTPVVQFSDRWSVFPTYSGFYRGTQDIQSLAGGGRLFRDSTGHSLLIKDVHTLGHWKLKPSVGGSFEWLREAKNEGWGQGLFDYRKANAGLEAEFNSESMGGGRAAYDYYQLAFPNYQSLESAQDPTLSRELAGTDVLDNTNHMATVGIWTPLPGRGRLEMTGFLDERHYGDQPVVNDQGQLTSEERKDHLRNLGAHVVNLFPPLFGVRGEGSVGYSYGTQTQNQDHYDVKQSLFLANYYDFEEWRLSPQISARLNQDRVSVSLGGFYERRLYTDRPAQDTAGGYVNEKFYVTTAITRLGIAYSLTARTKLRLDGSLGWSHSNTNYEDIFRYNYRTAGYGVGFSYDY